MSTLKCVVKLLDTTDGSNNNDINRYYIDGISLTHGSPCKHIWSFILGLLENFNLSGYPCDTNGTGAKSAPSFVGTDYYCESGNLDNSRQSKRYTNDPLWDGKDCGSAESNFPWLPLKNTFLWFR